MKWWMVVEETAFKIENIIIIHHPVREVVVEGNSRAKDQDLLLFA